MQSEAVHCLDHRGVALIFVLAHVAFDREVCGSEGFCRARERCNLFVGDLERHIPRLLILFGMHRVDRVPVMDPDEGFHEGCGFS